MTLTCCLRSAISEIVQPIQDLYVGSWQRCFPYTFAQLLSKHPTGPSTPTRGSVLSLSTAVFGVPTVALDHICNLLPCSSSRLPGRVLLAPPSTAAPVSGQVCYIAYWQRPDITDPLQHTVCTVFCLHVQWNSYANLGAYGCRHVGAGVSTSLESTTCIACCNVQRAVLLL